MARNKHPKHALNVHDASKHTLSTDNLSEHDISRVIEMAWEDRTPFEAIGSCYGLSESQTIILMRRHMKRKSFTMWRKRVSGRKTKHLQLRSKSVSRFRCPSQSRR